MQKIFGRVILGAKLGDPPDRGEVYKLDVLRQEAFEMPLDPTDGVEEVRVTKLKLRIIGKERRVITLEASGESDSKAVYKLLDDILAGGTIPRDLLVVQQVGLQFLFRSEDSGRPKRFSFTVSAPHSCTLKCDPRDDIAKDYLRKWGLDVSRRLEPGSNQSRQKAQLIIRE